jgi:hypothetical protein
VQRARSAIASAGRGLPPAVLVSLVTQNRGTLRRNPLHTAVIRGKRLVVIIGQPKALALAVKGPRARRRWSKLEDRLACCGGHLHVTMRPLRYVPDVDITERTPDQHLAAPIEARGRQFIHRGLDLVESFTVKIPKGEQALGRPCQNLRGIVHEPAAGEVLVRHTEQILAGIPADAGRHGRRSGCPGRSAKSRPHRCASPSEAAWPPVPDQVCL